jgi:preprotein translocase subunit Sec61beta
MRRCRLETFTPPERGDVSMSSGQNSGGLMSSAGLVRYFDSEDPNAIQIDPRSVVATGALFGIGVLLLQFFA